MNVGKIDVTFSSVLWSFFAYMQRTHFKPSTHFSACKSLPIYRNKHKCSRKFSSTIINEQKQTEN